jgi:hypothetical protein
MGDRKQKSNSGVRLRRCIGSIGLVAFVSAPPVKAADVGPPDPGLAQRFLATLGDSVPGPWGVTSVPTVGCRGGGQLGDQPPPRLPASVEVRLPAGQADRLAFYKAESTQGVLAPRGWKCFGIYGSDGDRLIVAPPEDGARLFGPDAGKTSGPAISITTSYGSTSGRFEVARVAARVFPVLRPFVEGVKAEGIEDPHAFVDGPWPGDALHRLSDRAVGFSTPVGANGLGAADYFAPGGMPILGVAFVTGGADEPTLTVLRARPGDPSLYPAIAVNALPSSADIGEAGAPAPDAAWKTIELPRFGCRVSIPASAFSQPEAPSGEGLTFRSPQGASLSLRGRYDKLSSTIAALERSLRTSSAFASVAYRASGPDWLVLSGYRGGDVYYARFVLSSDRHVVCGVDIEYPTAGRQAYDPLNGAIAKSLSAR